MADTDLPTDTTVEEAVLDGADLIPDSQFRLTGNSEHPDDILARRLDSLSHRLSAPATQTRSPVHAINIGDAGDLDGGTATALLRYNYGGGAPRRSEYRDNPGTAMESVFDHDSAGSLVALPAAYRDYYPDPADVLEEVLDVLEANDAETVPIYWTDLGANEDNADRLRDLFTRTDNPIRVRDHHTRHPALDAADEVVHDPEKCAAELVKEHDVPDAPDHLARLVEIARVRDLWLTDHPDFQEYAIFSDSHFTLGDAAFERLAAQFGADLPEIPRLGDELTRRREAKEARMEYALENAEWNDVELSSDHPLGPDTVTVCVLKGQFYVSEAARRAYTRGAHTDRDADIVVAAKPSGSVSLRAHDEYAVLDKVAGVNGGGGHPPAAGFSNTASEGASLDVKAKVALADTVRALREYPDE